MKTTGTQTKTIFIEDVPGLDPITVFLQNFSTGAGRVTIVCYGKSWTSFWGAMGDVTIEQFFIDSDEEYIAKNLSSINRYVPDWDKISDDLGLEVNQENHTLYYDEANKKYGSPPELPEIENHEYIYICRIIKAVQACLKELS